jgi:hypothetical protein
MSDGYLGRRRVRLLVATAAGLLVFGAARAATTYYLYDGAGNRVAVIDGTTVLADGAATTAKLADGAVTTAKLADGAVTAAKIATPEAWRVIGAPGQPGFLSGYSSIGGEFPAVSFRKDPSGYVQLRGSIRANYNGAAFVLPPGYRPSATLGFPVGCGVTAYSHVRADGTFAIGGASNASAVGISIDGIRFYAEQ